jgi:DNA polymerase-3 subunit epsilon
MKMLQDDNELYCLEQLGIRNARGDVARRIRELSPEITEEELLSLPLPRGRFLVVDLETTGMKARQAQVMEIGAVEVDGFGLGREFATLVNPGVPVPPFIAALTGIRDNMLIEAPGMGAVLPLLERMLKGRVLVAHNLHFDASFLESAWDQVFGRKIAAPTLCTVRLSRRVFPELGSHGLDAVAAHLGIRPEPGGAKARHRALGDARMTAALLVQICMRLRGEGVESVGDLIAFQSSRRARKRKKPRARLTLS